MSKSMDFKVGIADGQSDGLQVLGIGEPWPIYLEGMEECYILEPLVIGLSHSLNLGISFLMEHNLKINCTEEEVALMPVKDGSTSRAQLEDRRYHSFKSKKTGRVLKANEDQRISMQVWRIPHEKISINTLNERPEEALGVYAKEDCLIPTGNSEIHPSTDKL